VTHGRHVILSCEHAGNRVPAEYKHLFANHQKILESHRAYDIGIAPIARQLQKTLNCPLCLYPYTRLLVDVNRTRKRSQLSRFSRRLNDGEKQQLIDAYDTPYKQRLRQMVAEPSQTGGVLHVSLHSFTPVWNGQLRNAEIGILYDPARTQESDYARSLQSALRQQTGFRIRRNYPYLGRADGAATWLRKQFSQKRYLGIELELNQAFLASLTGRKQTDFTQTLAAAL
jgi:predicted N-formylglutamate amidohydrolase